GTALCHFFYFALSQISHNPSLAPFANQKKNNNPILRHNIHNPASNVLTTAVAHYQSPRSRGTSWRSGPLTRPTLATLCDCRWRRRTRVPTSNLTQKWQILQ